MSINKKVLIITLLMIIFVFNIGYAKFVDALTISGTSNAAGTFNIEFEDAKIESFNGINRSESVVKISQSKNELYINIADLSYPGASAVISANIINNGNIPAKIDSTNISGLKENSVINVKLIEGKEKILNQNEETKITIIVEWNKECTKNVNEVANFKIDLNYSQAY